MSRVKGTAIAILTIIMNAPVLTQSHGAEPPASSDPKPESRSESSPELRIVEAVQRDSHDAFIEKVRSRSLEQLENSLDEEESTVYCAGVMSSLEAAHNVFISVLADPRIEKIYSEYLELGPEQASVRSKALFEKWLNEHECRLQLAVDIYRKARTYELTIELDNSYYAVTASHFLMSRFCEPAEFRAALERWREIGYAAEDEVRAIESPYSYSLAPLNGECAPDSLLELNLCLAFLQANLDDDALSSVVQDDIKIKPYLLREKPYFKWNAYAFEFDFTQIRESAPSNDPAIIAHYKFVDTWGRVHAHREASQQGFVQRARASIRSIE